ncbi:uncharacterized protein FPRN_00512 [Fusarium proliferatum]|nr:uncharacterized protein FPRN_00512 [Fusarium proliferatum]
MSQNTFPPSLILTTTTVISLTGWEMKYKQSLEEA